MAREGRRQVGHTLPVAGAGPLKATLTRVCRVDPIDQTMLTYMDSGEVISCDIVVLKDDKGNKIFVT